jgi:hypothetical protein
MSSNLNGKCYLLPLLDLIRKRRVPGFSAWEGFDSVEDEVSTQGFSTSEIFVAMDYTSMDTTFGLPQLQFVVDVCAPVFQPQYRDGLAESILHGATAAVMIDIDTLVTGDHGELSGHEWTNFVESVGSLAVHLLIRDEIEKIGGKVLVDQLLGDDGMLSFTNVPLNEEELAHVIVTCSKRFGLISNPEKQRIDDNTSVYLQRFFDKDIKIPGTSVVAGCYPGVLALNTAMNPERFHDPDKWGPTMEILRWIMILENCHTSPYFHDIIDIFVEGDVKCGLGTRIPGYFKRGIAKDYDVAKSIPGFVPSYTEAHTRRGIYDFDTFQYLLNKTNQGGSHGSKEKSGRHVSQRRGDIKTREEISAGSEEGETSKLSQEAVRELLSVPTLLPVSGRDGSSRWNSSSVPSTENN